MKTTLGKSTKNDEAIMSLAIQKLNDNLDDGLHNCRIESGLINISKDVSPRVLWPVDNEKYDKLFGRSSKKIKSNSMDLTIYEKNYSSMTDDECLEKCIHPLAKAVQENMKLIDSSSKPQSHFYCLLDDRIIGLFDTRYRCLRAKAAASPFNIILSADAMSMPNDFERKVLACFNLSRQFTIADLVYVIDNSMEMLDSYKDMIKYEWKEKNLTDHQMLQLVGIWMRSLSMLFEFYAESYMNMENEFTSMNITRQTLTIQKQRIFIQLKSSYNKCFELTQWAKNNGFFNVAAGKYLLKLFKSSLLMANLQKLNIKKNMALILIESLECYINITVEKNDKRQAYESYIWLTGFLGYKERFNQALEDGSELTFLPMIIGIWDNVGVIGKDYSDVSKRMIRPEYAIQYLISVRKKIKELTSLDQGTEYLANFIRQHRHDLLDVNVLLPRVVIYFYLRDEIDKANEILKLGKIKCCRFYSFLLLIAKEEFEEAVMFMEKELAKSKEDTPTGESFKDLQHMRIRIISILALLHKSLADAVSDKDKKSERHIENALSYLTESVANRKELHLSIAGIKEQTGDLNGAYESYCCAEKYFNKFPVGSLQHSQLGFVGQAKEKLRDLLEANVSKKDISSLELKMNETLINIEKSKQKQKSKSKSKSKSKNLVDETVEVLTSKVENIGLPFAGLSMEENTSKTNMEKNKSKNDTEFSSADQSEEYMQEDIDEDWRIVDRRAALKASIPNSIMTEVVECEMLKTKKDRNSLYEELLLSANIDYNKILNKHDELYKKSNNIIIKQIFLQNRMWTLRHKTWNFLALSYESIITGVPIIKIKTDLRKEILEKLYSNIENVLEELTSESLPEIWRTNPEIILESKKIIYIFSQECISFRLRIQIGAQLATIAHVLQDIDYDKSKSWGRSMKYLVNAFGENIKDFKKLSGLYYQCRNQINPDHVSHIY